jgi:hypothetical protein
MTGDWDERDADEDEEFGPGDPDYDLSEQHGYMWDPQRRDWPVPSPALIVVSVLVIVALVLPSVLLVLRAT